MAVSGWANWLPAAMAEPGLLHPPSLPLWNSPPAGTSGPDATYFRARRALLDSPTYAVEETTMDPHRSYRPKQAHIAGLHHQAARNALAREDHGGGPGRVRYWVGHGSPPAVVSRGGWVM